MSFRSNAQAQLGPTHNKKKETSMPSAVASAPETSAADGSVNPTPVSPPSMDTLRANLQAAETALATAQATITAAGASNDIPGMIAGAGAVTKAESAIVAAKRAINVAEFEVRSGERNAASGALKDALVSALANVDLAPMVALQLTGATITLAEDGTATVSVTSKAFPKGDGSPRGPRTATVGGGSLQIHYNGGAYTSREFLNAFGDQLPCPERIFGRPSSEFGLTTLGAWAIYRVDHYKEFTGQDGNAIKLSPGFDSPMKQLARKLGATVAKAGMAIDLG